MTVFLIKGITTNCTVDTNKYWSTTPFTADHVIHIIDHYIVKDPLFISDGMGVLYSNYNLNNPPIGCPAPNDTTQFIMTSNTGGTAMSALLHPSANYTVITCTYSSVGVAGSKAALYIYSGELLTPQEITSGLITTSPVTSGDPTTGFVTTGDASTGIGAISSQLSKICFYF